MKIAIISAAFAGLFYVPSASAVVIGGPSNIISETRDLTAFNSAIVVDDSFQQVDFVLSGTQPILDVSLLANLSASGGSIDGDGSIDSTNNPFLNELILTLISPQGSSLELVSESTYTSGGSGSELVELLFQDGGASQGGVDLSPGTFAPAGGSFSVFDGESPNGIWSLVIEDTVGADPKSLNGFTINVETAPVPEPSTSLLFALGAFGLVWRRR